MTQPLFSPGQIVFTPGAMDLLSQPGARFMYLLYRHLHGDWGDLDEGDKAENNLSVREGFRILSAYKIGSEKIWIITEADRSVTTFLLPSEY
jgi:hypothetical protein